jgi:hypothetical protein
MPLSKQRRSSDTISWWLIVAMLCVCLVGGYRLGFRIDPAGTVPPAIGLGILYAAMLFGRIGGRPRLQTGATAFMQMTLFTLAGVVLAYILAARAGPLWDASLASADRAMGLDWPSLFRLADTSHLAIWIGGLSYHSLTLQMIVCIVVLSASGRVDRLRVTVAAAISSGFVTILLSGAMPAMGNVFDPAAYRLLWPSVAWMERGMIAGLRDGTWRTLDLTQLMGIVTFPSYHATLPIILAWAQRDMPRWRIPAGLWAGVTIIATPVFGGHYGVDVLAGIMLALVALALAPRLVFIARPAMKAPGLYVGLAACNDNRLSSARALHRAGDTRCGAVDDVV